MGMGKIGSALNEQEKVSYSSFIHSSLSVMRGERTL